MNRKSCLKYFQIGCGLIIFVILLGWGILSARDYFIKVQGSKGWTTFFMGESLFSPEASIMKVDDNGNVWMGHVYRQVGLEIYMDDQRLIFPEINKVNGIVFDDEGKAWVGTDNQGVIVFNTQSYEIESVYNAQSSQIPDNEIFSIDLDLNGQIWIVTVEGASVFDGTKWVTHKLKCESRERDYLLNGSLTVDLKNRVWIVEKQCVHIFDDPDWVTFPLSTRFISNRIVADQDGIVWIISSGGYIYTCNAKDEEINCEGYEDDLSWFCGFNCINSITLDDEKHLWVATHNGAFSFRDGSSKRFYTENSGTLNNDILSIAFKGDEIWFGHEGGISIYSPDNEQITLPENIHQVESVIAVPTEIPFERESRLLLSAIQDQVEAYNIEVSKAYIQEGGVVQISRNEDGELEQKQSDLLLVDYQAKGDAFFDADGICNEIAVLFQFSFLSVEDQGHTVTSISINVYDDEQQRIGSISTETENIGAFQVEETSVFAFERTWNISLDSDYRGPLQNAFRYPCSSQ